MTRLRIAMFALLGLTLLGAGPQQAAPAGGAGNGGEKRARTGQPRRIPNGVDGARRKLGAERAGPSAAKPGGGKGGKVGQNMGNSMLRSGNNAAAAVSFRKAIKHDPTQVAAHVGLGKSLARDGKCEDALVELLPWVDTVPFGADAALLTSTCAHRLGFLEDAVYFDRLAIDIEPDSARAWSNLALDLQEVGDVVGVAEALDKLDLLGRDGRDASFYPRAVLAIREGNIDEFDILAHLWKRERRSKDELRRLTAQTWLDMDDPVMSLATIESVRKLNRSYQEACTRAEATRRAGDPEGALTLIDRHGKRPLQGSAAEAVRIRARVDSGDIDGARSLLAEYDDIADEEIVASAWYVAHAQDDAAGMARAARDYAEVQVSPLRTLASLVPVPAR